MTEILLKKTPLPYNSLVVFSCTLYNLLSLTLGNMWFALDLWFSLSTPISSTNQIDRHNIIESGVKHHIP